MAHINELLDNQWQVPPFPNKYVTSDIRGQFSKQARTISTLPIFDQDILATKLEKLQNYKTRKMGKVKESKSLMQVLNVTLKVKF